MRDYRKRQKEAEQVAAMTFGEKGLADFTDVYDMPLEQKEELGIITVEEQCAYLKITVSEYNKYEKQLQQFRDSCSPNEMTLYKVRMRNLAMSDKGSAKDRENYGRMLGAFMEQKRDIPKAEFTVEDNIKLACQVRDALKQEYKESNACPVCHRFKEGLITPKPAQLDEMWVNSEEGK